MDSWRGAAFVLAAAVLALIVVVTVAPVLYEVFRVPDYYECEPFWPFDCQPGGLKEF